MKIGEFAKAGGVGVETVRFYHRKELLALPEAQGVRRYSKADLRRLLFVRKAQAAGFTLQEIGELIALDAGQDHARARELAAGRLGALDRQIAELTQAREALHRLADRCARQTSGPCPIIAAFD